MLKQKTEMKRGPWRKELKTAEPKPKAGPRARKCKNRACRKEFVPSRGFEEWCGPDCGAVVALDRVAKQKAKEQRADRADTKKKLDKFKSIPTLKAEAQVIFNRWVRLRDEMAGYACICCDKVPAGAEALTGGAWDAAHYRSRGSADHLRYDERNVHASLKTCNTWGHTDYRGGLIARIGLAAVEALEADNGTVKWTREYLEGIKTEYAEKFRKLKASR